MYNSNYYSTDVKKESFLIEFLSYYLFSVKIFKNAFIQLITANKHSNHMCCLNFTDGG